jgi:hypothetical protein
MTKVPTVAEEIWISVREWYRERGENVPLDEATACLRDIANEKKELIAFWASITAYRASGSSQSPKRLTGVDWKAYWDKKKAKGWVKKEGGVKKMKGAGGSK